MSASDRGSLGRRWAIISCLAVAACAFIAAACNGDSDKPATASPTGPAATLTQTPGASPAAASSPSVALSPTQPPAATPSPTPPPANQAKLPQALMAADRITTLVGAGFRTLQDKATDAELPFSSVPAMGATLKAQGVSLIYNSYQSAAAPPAGRPFAAQNTTQGYPSPNNAGTAFTALRTEWQGTLFKNLQPQATPAGWDESFCQLGDFTSTSGQTSQWFVCMARSGPYIVTVSVGGFVGLDAAAVGTVVRAYFDDALAVLR